MEKYINAELEIIEFDTEDIITTSVTSSSGSDEGEPVDPWAQT